MTKETSTQTTQTTQFLTELAELLGKYGAELCSECSTEKIEVFIDNKQVFKDYEISQTIIEKKITEKKNWLVLFFNDRWVFNLNSPLHIKTFENCTMLEAEKQADEYISTKRGLEGYSITEMTLELCLAAVKPTNTQS